MVGKDPNKKNRKFNINRKLLGKIFSALEGIDIQQSNLVSKINNRNPESTMPSPSRDGRENQINFEEGLDRVYGTKPASNQEDYPEGLNPFASGLQKIKLSARESKGLSRLKSAIVTAKNPSELNKVVDEAIAAGMRMNGCDEGGRSFAEYVILGMHFHKFKKGDQKKIMSKLILRGAEFHDNLLQNKLLGEIYKELQPEVQPQIDKRLKELRKVGESAVQRGAVIDVEMDNKTFFMEFSEDSKIEVAKVLEGTRNLGLDKWLGSNIIKMGGSEVEVKSEKGGKRDYTDVSDNSAVEIAFPTSIGSLRVVVYHSAENDHQVQVRVADIEMWAELQKRGEVIGKGCLFGGMTVKEAVEKGSFPRDGKWSKEKVTEEIKAVSETLSWVDRTCGGSQEAFRKR
ncbi:hypothetical protein [Wolbachia endosymbiont of Muscidifurax uniraptor]